MIEDTIDINTRSGVMQTFVVRPHGNKASPPVVLFMDIWGVREELRQIARRIANQGYVAILPNFYYRQGEISYEFYDEKSRMISLHHLEKTKSDLVNEQRRRLSNEMIVADIIEILGFIEADKYILSEKVGALGWCMGGWICLKAGVTFPQKFQAIATLHATRPISETEGSPHRELNKLRGGLYSGWAELDHLSPPDMVRKFENLIELEKVDYRSVIHDGVEHGYALPDRDIYSPEAAAQDWEQIVKLYKDYL